MISSRPTLTNRGKSLLMRAIAGEAMTFTRFKIGSGELGEDRTGDDLNDLINPMLTFPIIDMDASQEGLVVLSGEFDNSSVTEDFVWREMGVYAKGEDEEEVLYAYANDGDAAGTLRALNTEVMIEQTIALIVAVGEAEHVTAVFSPRQQYALAADLADHKANTNNPHKVTKENVGLGNVENAAPSDGVINFTESPADTTITTGEKLGALMGKIAKVIRSAIAHFGDQDNPHAVTLKQVGGAAAEHEHKAEDVTSGVFTLQQGGTGVKTLDALKDLIGFNGQMGTYPGDGNKKRLIPLDFRPSAVILCNSRGKMGDSEAGVCGGIAVGLYGLRSPASNLANHATAWNDDYTALLIDEGGFYVNYKESETPEERIATNVSGETYYYIAFRGKE